MVHIISVTNICSVKEMDIRFLTTLHEEYLNQKFFIENKLNKIQMRIKENSEMLKLLERTDDVNFESFTPREVYKKDRDKICDLREEQKLLQDTFEKEKENLIVFDEKISGLAELIKEAEKMVCLDETDHREKKEKETYLVSFLEMQENERQRISRELHDTTVQNLTGLVHKTELCSKLVELDPLRCRLELNMISKTLREVIEEMRGMIYNLRPMSFDDIGLEVTIQRTLDKIENSESKIINFKVIGQSYEIKPIIGITLLRIIQEGCNNAIRHADSSVIQVSLKYEADKICIEIEDNGKGFDVDTERGSRDDNSGFGLSMMKERVYLLSGNIKIKSRINCGTTIYVEIPVVG